MCLTDITQDEPSTGPDPDASGIGESTALLRAARSGKGDGRVYHVSFEAGHEGDHQCTGIVLVSIPRDRGHDAVDQGPLVNSAVP